jgi:uncharacterized cysteine cluster protein YcgN (CxxCxxCC family)
MSTKKAGWVPGTLGEKRGVKAVGKAKDNTKIPPCDRCGRPLVKRLRHTGKKKMKLVRVCCEGV